MVRNIRTSLLCAVGIISIALSIKCFSIKDLDYETKSAYGGDAFTGIQNAAAITSKNVKELTSVVQFGFGSLLLVNGLTLLVFGLTSPIQKNESENTKVVENTSSTGTAEKETEVSENNEIGAK